LKNSVFLGQLDGFAALKNGVNGDGSELANKLFAVKAQRSCRSWTHPNWFM